MQVSIWYWNGVNEQEFGKRKMADSDFNFFFKNPKYPLGNPPFCLWNHQKWFWGPKIAPLSFSQKFWKNITPHVFAPSTLNFCPIFKCHTILESWRVAGFDGTKISWVKICDQSEISTWNLAIQGAVTFYFALWWKKIFHRNLLFLETFLDQNFFFSIWTY